ncbi:MAG: glucosamine-6-phosphate deaminase, partial [Kiritimatiellaeota bacterium]|nr:glucosamine-6-phosphate deaminase [Kiritimatiellota bacterium]
RVAEYIRGNPDTLVCFAAGDTPLGMLRELVALQGRGEVNLASVYYAGLDEWVGLGRDDIGSCAQVMTDTFYAPAKIPAERMHIFDGLATDLARECRAMDDWIEKHGGIAFTVLGIGMNGHVGFNEPDAPDTPHCFTVPLDDTTRRVSVKYFGKPLPVETGITISCRALLCARTILFLANGPAKADIIRATLHGPVTPAVPSSLFQSHPDTTLVTESSY